MLKRNMTGLQRKKKKGQSTVEYIILVAAIFAALIIFFRPGGLFQNAFNQALNEGARSVGDFSNRLSTTRGTPP